MRIPLDYYRILGLPIQATAEQLRQAYRDRTLQLPRREYSETAIASRKTLLDEAYAVLSSQEQRQTYDSGFLAKTYDLPPEPEIAALVGADRPLGQSTVTEPGGDLHTPSLDIQDHQFVGALLILQDLGEYELVLRLGRPFLTGGSASLKNGQYGDPAIVLSDIVLTVALACLELGREQWQQGQYENAAEALETGQQLLLREGLFAGVRGEIQTDLYKLRPYRILELLALSEDRTNERYQGMQLLQDMLQERGGIDGSENDQSGLNIDDFLRFIQQLRSYLTAAEQQVLFEQEAHRPSAVATYLAVYALLARGFSECQPALIRRAKLLLLRLSNRQDVHLEQSVCALLLGQTEEASRALELSQEYGPIAFIREHSQGSPDLLPGLCLYAERWLQDEVFPHFRDLAQQRVSLKEYFADLQVQEYLEELPSDNEARDEWSLDRPVGMATSSSGSKVATANFAPRSFSERGSNDRSVDNSLIEIARAQAGSRSATAMLAGDRATNGETPLPAAERVVQIGSNARPTPNRSGGDRPGGTERVRESRTAVATPAPSRRREPEQARPRPARPKESGVRKFLLPAVLFGGMVALGFLVAWLFRTWETSSKPTLQVEQPNIQLDRPLVELPTASPSPDPNAPLTNASAQQVVQSWLTAKAAAMGEGHKLEPLEQILAEPKLSEWRNAAEDARRGNWYKQYQHQVKVVSLEADKANPDQAKVLADVTESTEYYEGGTLKNSKTDADLRVEYSLVRQDGKWRIQNWKVLP